MTPAKALILKDLGHNLRTKVSRDVNDFIDLCEVSDLDTRDVAAELMTMFVQVTASMAADHFDVSAQDFAVVMAEQFLKVKKRAEVTGS